MLTKSTNTLKVTVDATAEGNEACQVRWDWTNDGTWDTNWSPTKVETHTYEAEGDYTVAMEIKDPLERSDSGIKEFKLTLTNTNPKASFAVNMVQGMTASVDASSSTDSEDKTSDLMVRWDWNNDGEWDTGYSTTKTATHLYATAGQYTIKLQVKDMNNATDGETETIVASPITIRNSVLFGQQPFLMRLNFRLINNETGLPITQTDTPALTRSFFTLYEDNVAVDMSETTQILKLGTRPMRLVLVLDFTGSISDAGGIGPMVSAAKAFIDSQPETTKLCLWAFWERQGGDKEIDDFTRCTVEGKAKLKADLDAFVAQPHDQGLTQIWDLLKKIMAMKFLDLDTRDNRSLVFLTDGHDTTSKTTISQLIDVALHKKAVVFYPVGLAFRPDDYPSDEANLKKLATDTGGEYFTVTQVSDLTNVFNQIAQGLLCDWTLSYVTPKTSGTHTLKAECNYMNGKAWTTIKYTIADGMMGDIRKGLLSVYPESQTDTQTEYTLYADYIPRNISTFRVKVTSSNAASLTLYDSDAICLKSDGWTITPDVAAGQSPPADGWYTITGPTPLEYGEYGRIAKCTVDAVDLPTVTFDLPALTEQAMMYGDKNLVFWKMDNVSLTIPTLATGISSVATHGTPADPNEPSANASQKITIIGRGLTPNDYVVFHSISSAGDRSIVTVQPDSVSVDGLSMQVTVPASAYTGKIFLYNDFLASEHLLQIVPHITKYTPPASAEERGKYSGSGFIEGAMTAYVNGSAYADGGIDAADGIDVTGNNTYFSVTYATNGATPVYVVTEGGTSEPYAP